VWRVYERIEHIDLESMTKRASLASQADLLTFGVGDLSAWIVEAAASASCFSLSSLGLTYVHKTDNVADWSRLQNGQEIAISTTPGAGVCCDRYNLVNS
jgi:hypothetical protein